MNFLIIPSEEIYRKVIHLSSIVYPILYSFFFEKNQIIIILLGIFALLVFAEFLRKFKYCNKVFYKFFGFALRQKEINGKVGATYFIAGILFTAVIFEKNIAVTSMYVLIICDTLASIIGITFGGKIFLQNIFSFFNKSIEGYLAFVMSCFVILLLSFHKLPYTVLILLSLMIAFIEVVSQKLKVDDNLSIPIFCASLLYLAI